jgi:hypothetical protein
MYVAKPTIPSCPECTGYPEIIAAPRERLPYRKKALELNDFGILSNDQH